MQRRILAVLDGSPLGEAVLPDTVALARATCNSVTLLQVLLPVEVVSTGAWGISAPALARRRRKRLCAARSYLEGVAAVLRSQGLVVYFKAVEGNPAATVVSQVRQDASISAIAIATHYGKGISHPLFGSVSVVQELLRSAPVPLLLVSPDSETVLQVSGSTTPHPPHPPYRTILVPLDGSPLAEQALRRCQVLAYTFSGVRNNPNNPDNPIEGSGVTLVLLSVVPNADPSKTTGDVATLLRTQGTRETERHERGIEEEQAAWGEANSLNLYLYLQETAQQLRRQGHVVQTRIAHGDPAGEIVRSSEETHADLIVMTSHGLNAKQNRGLHRLWVSSVATEVVRRATVPVLLVNTGEYDEREEDGEGYGVGESEACCAQDELAAHAAPVPLRIL
ncbi:MAG: universal stress protein [Chloroflexi bacterium]|nr:universal stress protein [Chloroflexota bacterium]